MNTDYDITLVEKYFDRELTEAESQEFHDRIKTDISFKALVDQEKILIRQVRHEGLQKDLNYLQSLEKTLSSPQANRLNSRGLAWHYYAAAAVVAVLAIVGIWNYSPQETPDKLFTAYFKPYSNVFEPTVRGSEGTTPTQRSEAFQAYEEGDYQKAVTLFSALNKEKSEPGILLLMGNANLILGNIKEAESNFITLSRDFDELDLQAQWYLGLCYLKSGDIENARKVLEELGKTEVSYSSKAKELLKKVD